MRTYTIFDLMDACAKVDRWNKTEESNVLLQKATKLIDAFDLPFMKNGWREKNSKDEFMRAMYYSYKIIERSNNFTENPFEGMLEAPEYIGKMFRVYSNQTRNFNYFIENPQQKIELATEMKLTVFRYFFGDVNKTVTLEDQFLV